MQQAIIMKGAEIDEGVHIGHGAVIHPNVRIFRGARIGAYSVIGGEPEHKGFYGRRLEELKGVVIGEEARVFEFVTVHAGTVNPTTIHPNASVFNHAHIAHDVVIYPEAVVGGHCTLAGHVIVRKYANVGGRATVHQKVVIGDFTMIALGAVVRKHVPPGQTWIGTPARFAGFNTVGLSRAVHAGLIKGDPHEYIASNCWPLWAGEAQASGLKDGLPGVSDE